jgi:hypothetical protein
LEEGLAAAGVLEKVVEVELQVREARVARERPREVGKHRRRLAHLGHLVRLDERELPKRVPVPPPSGFRV